jgi:hypothetical protein
MYFGTKSYLKSNHYHTVKHPLKHWKQDGTWGRERLPLSYIAQET